MTFKTKLKIFINKSCVNVVRFFGFWIVLLIAHAKVKKYIPQNKNFIVIANHSDALDPIYILCSLRRYVRYVMGDHVIFNPIVSFFLKTMCGWIVKGRDNHPSVLINDMMESAKQGVPLGLFAEGAITPNGETGFFSPRTGQLVKDLGVALITYRVKGGFFHTPRWGTGLRKGRIHAGVVHEYSAEELAGMTAEEVNALLNLHICVCASDM